MGRTALITGITGQDGAYLAKLLLEKGYEVHGGARRTSNGLGSRLTELGIAGDVRIHEFDLAEFTNVRRVLERIRPDELYNLAAQSFVGVSFEQPIYTANVDAIGPLRILEALRDAGSSARFYQASTSEMFGRAETVPQNEGTPFYPRSPYGVAKLFAHWTTVNYREAYGLHASSGILFNHESPLRGEEFVTRKITLGLARIRHGLQEAVEIGNLDARRDWGFAGDFVAGMWRMLQQDAPDDFVLATGVSHSVRDFAVLAAAALGMTIAWRGSGAGEEGIDTATGKAVLRVNPDFYRPTEVNALLGDATRAATVLGWRATTPLEELAAMMAAADERRVRDGLR